MSKAKTDWMVQFISFGIGCVLISLAYLILAFGYSLIH